MINLNKKTAENRKFNEDYGLPDTIAEVRLFFKMYLK